MLILTFILAVLLGTLIGTITGTFPGFHVNLICAIVLGLSSSLFILFSPLSLAIFLVALSTTHIFVNFIPSIFLGAPDEDSTALSILPGHDLLIKGEGYSAIIYTLYGCLIGLVLTLIFSPLFYLFLPIIYPYAAKIMPFILILASIFLIYFEKTSRIWAIIIFILAGFLGLSTLTLPIKEPMLPLFTGLFGISSLLVSINKKQKLPFQKVFSLKKINQSLKSSSIFKSVFATIISSPLCSFLPGLGSGQAAVIGSEVTGELDRKEFLILLGSISMIVTSLSFITLYTIGKARSGIAVALEKLINISLTDLYYITGAMIFSGIIAFFIAIFIARIFARLITKVNYSKLSIGVIIVLILVSVIFSGFLGLLVLFVSTILGLLCINSGIRRTHLMGCLIIPAIILLIF